MYYLHMLSHIRQREFLNLIANPTFEDRGVELEEVLAVMSYVLKFSLVLEPAFLTVEGT